MFKLSSVTVSHVMWLGILIRVLFLIYGEWQDRTMVVKYTDIDYKVFTDAARHVTQGNSPFRRTTYRYTPLLAFFMTPNIFLFMSFGKIVFCIADLLIGWMCYRFLISRNIDRTKAVMCVALYVLNPLCINVSTRGNAESIIGLFVVGAVCALAAKRLVLSAVLYGLSVHLKIYPILYAIPYLFALGPHYEGVVTAFPTKFWDRVRFECTASRFKFTFISASVFFFFTGVLYLMYGWEFLYETYLYHIVRKDHRHNFSVYFYYLYLTFDDPSSAVTAIATFLPQLILTITIAYRYRGDLAFTVFAQTIAFVTYNKVITIQYFVWYLAVLPLVIPSSSITIKKCIMLSVAFAGTCGTWLYYAYLFEFVGENTFLRMWYAGCAFFLANIWFLSEFIRHHKSMPLFTNGTLTQWINEEETAEVKSEQQKKED